MGRITPSFRQQFQQELHDLQKYRDELRTVELKNAFDILKKVWSFNQATMMYTEIPCVLTLMLLTSVVDNRRLILKLSEKISEASLQIDRLFLKLSKD